MSDKYIMRKINLINDIFDRFMIKKLKAEGLPVLQNHITLFHILPEDGSDLLFNEIARLWKISKSSLSDIINKYENQGLIEKSVCDADKRSIYIRLTEKAIPVRQRVLALEEDFISSLLRDFTYEQKENLECNINKSLNNIKEIL